MIYLHHGKKMTREELIASLDTDGVENAFRESRDTYLAAFNIVGDQRLMLLELIELAEKLGAYKAMTQEILDTVGIEA